MGKVRKPSNFMIYDLPPLDCWDHGSESELGQDICLLIFCVFVFTARHVHNVTYQMP
jgi:hypothetical protein